MTLREAWGSSPPGGRRAARWDRAVERAAGGAEERLSRLEITRETVAEILGGAGTDEAAAGQAEPAAAPTRPRSRAALEAEAAGRARLAGRGRARPVHTARRGAQDASYPPAWGGGLFFLGFEGANQKKFFTFRW